MSCLSMLHVATPCVRLIDVLQVEPTNGNATLNLGLVYLDLNLYAEAEEYFKHSLMLSSGNKGALLNMAVLLEKVER